jgi:hypothetical protein
MSPGFVGHDRNDRGRFDSYHTRKPDGPRLALANEGTACCNALRRDWHEATFHWSACIRLLFGGIGDIACDPTSLIEPRRPGTRKAILPSQRPDLLKRLFDDPLIERGVERERRRANDQKKIA